MSALDVCTVVAAVYLICIICPEIHHPYRGETFLCAAIGALIGLIWFGNLISIWIGATAGTAAAGLHGAITSITRK